MAAERALLLLKLCYVPNSVPFLPPKQKIHAVMHYTLLVEREGGN